MGCVRGVDLNFLNRDFFGFIHKWAFSVCANIGIFSLWSSFNNRFEGFVECFCLKVGVFEDWVSSISPFF